MLKVFSAAMIRLNRYEFFIGSSAKQSAGGRMRIGSFGVPKEVERL